MANGMKLFGGTIVDATLIAAPPSIKNQDKARYPEMHQTKKGKNWHLGMKLHIDADSKTGLIHHASVTAANVHDSQEVANLLHGQETWLYGDSACRAKTQRERLKELGPKAKDFTCKRAYKNRPLTEADKASNRRKSSVRSKVEHRFLTLKRLWVGQSPLSWSRQEHQSGVCHAGDAQHQQQMGTTSDRRGESCMRRIGGISRIPTQQGR